MVKAAICVIVLLVTSPLGLTGDNSPDSQGPGFSTILRLSLSRLVRNVLDEMAKYEPVVFDWEEPRVERIQVPTSPDLLFVVWVPTLYASRAPRLLDSFHSEYAKRVIATLVDTTLDHARNIAVPAEGRLVIVAIENPPSNSRGEAAKVYLSVTAMDINDFRNERISRDQLKGRITISRDSERSSVRIES